MIKIQVTSPSIREMKGIGKTSGKPYHMRFQTGYAFTIDRDGVAAPFPDKFEFTLEDGQLPLQAGFYTLQPSSVFVSREFGRLEMTPRLVAVPAPATRAA